MSKIKIINVSKSETGQDLIDLNKIKRTDDGAIFLNGYPLRVGNYEYLDYEIGAGYEGKTFIGHITTDEAARVAGLLKGLPITYEHTFIDDLADRNTYGIGALLDDGELQDDGRVRNQIMIDDASAIAKAGTQKFNQLSLGFFANIETKNVPDGADFLLTDIEPNHVALVRYGRAGAGGALANSKSITKENKMETKELQAQVEKLTLENTALKNAQTEIERLKAENDMLKQSQKTDADIKAEAVALANKWQELGDKIEILTGSKTNVDLSNSVDAMKSALINSGSKLPEGASDAYIEAAFDFAVTNKQSQAKPIDAAVSVGGIGADEILGVK